jgi:hypothetical protein
MVRRVVASFLLALLLLVWSGAVAQQPQLPSGNAADDRSRQVSDTTIERLRRDVTYLASEQLDGRRTGTDAARLAAKYIADRFSELRLEPAGGPNSGGGSSRRDEKPLFDAYFQDFPYVAGVETANGNQLLFTSGTSGLGNKPIDDVHAATNSGELTGGMEAEFRARSSELRLGEDWLPLGFSSNGQVPFRATVFVGYGLTAAELQHDDYAGLNVKDRIAVALEGTPDGDNPHGQFARFADVRWKAIAARDHGATALVVIAREENFKDDPLSRLRYDNIAGDAGIVAVVVSHQAAQRMFPGALSGPKEPAKTAILSSDILARKSGAGASGNSPHSPAKSGDAQGQSVAMTLNVNLLKKNLPAMNVIGVLKGSDPDLRNQAIVLGAHYDHLGRGGEGSLAQREGEVHHGADDNASGVAALLELARIFSAQPGKLRRSIVFVAFSGEEEGLIGSNFYVNNPAWPLAQTVAMVNMDMIGRMRDRKLIVGGVGTAKEWRDLVDTANRAGGEQTRFALTLNEDGFGPSDHSSFYAKQVPVLFLFTGTHDDYHKPSDTADKINYEDEGRIVDFVAGLVRSLDKSNDRPSYTVAKSESTGRSTGFRVYLGTIPNYAESSDGLRLDGVREDSPAAKAGLKAGDRIVKLAGREVKNVYDYTYALGEMKAGTEYEIEIVRGTDHLRLKITPVARKP